MTWPPPALLKACAWSGPAFVLVLFAGMLTAGLVPPPGPHETVDQVVDFYADDPTRVRVGLLLMLFAPVFFFVFVTVIAYLMRHAEDGRPLLTYLQLLSGSAGIVAATIPTLLFTVAAFRPGRTPELTQTLNDLAWIPFVANFPAAMAQSLAIGVLALSRAPRQVFPRWVGYYNLWVVLLLVPGGLIFFFKTGPLAWDGVLGFWVLAVTFGTWFLIMTGVMLRAIKRLQPAAPPTPAAAAAARAPT